jgi:5-formyltetrahydrofolate cyclo-ligase
VSRRSRSKRIVWHLIELNEYIASSKALSYLQIGNEVVTTEFAAHALSCGKALYLPRVRRDTRELEVVRVHNLCDDLHVGTYGILEPVEALAAATEEEICEIGFAVIPGVAFDKDGYRLGRGGGYFDRFLPRLSHRCMTVGVCFEEQLVERVPRDPWDVPVRHVVVG